MIHTMKNKYIIRSIISEAKFREIFKVFFYFAYAHSFAKSMDIESIKIAKLCKVSQKTTDKIIKSIRILIAK